MKPDTDAVRRINETISGELAELGSFGGILVGYSGGVDSTVLLSALAELGIRPLRVLHVVHNLRPEAELLGEKELIRKYCGELKLPLRIATIKPGSIEKRAKRKGIGIEAAARELRYGILLREAGKYGCGIVCTAHNADDQLETLLSRFLGSSSFEGLRGMPKVRRLGGSVRLCRPLLAVPRGEIQDYASIKGLKLSQDSSNDSSVYLRNRIRKKLVPVLDREFPGWRKGLETTASRLAADGGILDARLMESFARIEFSETGRSASMRVEDFLSLPEGLRIRLLTRCMRYLTRKGRLSYRALQEACRALSSGAKACDLFKYRLTIEDDRLRILPILDFRKEGGYFFIVSDEAVLKAGSLEVSCRWADSDRVSGPGQASPVTALAEGSFGFPLAIRSRKPGDKIRCGGKYRRIDQLLSGWGIEARHRDLVPLIEDGNGIVAILADCLEGLSYGQHKFRDYSGPLKGRSFVIRIKGANF
jgi:tRNA(Ile)-lysidine synthase